MVKDVITIEFGSSAVEAAKLMKEHDIGSVVIVQENKAKGIITERDIVRKLVSVGKIDSTVEQIMSSPIIVVKPEVTLEDASKAMHSNKIKRLIVIDNEDALAGIISEDDIIKLLPSLLELVEEKAYAFKEKE